MAITFCRQAVLVLELFTEVIPPMIAQTFTEYGSPPRPI
jgi:hypothetical protein